MSDPKLDLARGYVELFASPAERKTPQFDPEDDVPPMSLVNAPLDSKVFKLGRTMDKPIEENLIRRRPKNER